MSRPPLFSTSLVGESADPARRVAAAPLRGGCPARPSAPGAGHRCGWPASLALWGSRRSYGSASLTAASAVPGAGEDLSPIAGEGTSAQNRSPRDSSLANTDQMLHFVCSSNSTARNLPFRYKVTKISWQLHVLRKNPRVHQQAVCGSTVGHPSPPRRSLGPPAAVA